MVKLETQQMSKIAPLFENTKETLIWSCLDGCMGHAWADSPEDPDCAQILTAELCFFAGNSQSPEAALLVNNIPGFYNRPVIFMVPENEAWGALIEKKYENRFIKFNRYAIKKEKDVFDMDRLKGFLDKLPSEYQLAPIDENLFNKSKQEDWSCDLCAQFTCWQDFNKHAIGFVVLHEGKPVSGASTYTYYNGGIEIEIDTKMEYRRKGLATVCASKLIMECIDRGLYPSWDAANLESVALSEKLGYHFERAYTTYQINLVKTESPCSTPNNG